MKYEWEEKDIKCGRFVCRSEPANGFNPETAANTTYKIGYIGSSSDGFYLISMTDGMIGERHTKQELVRNLNETKMNPMSHKHLMQVLDFLRDLEDRWD